MTLLAPIANHLWQSTVFAALVALVTRGFRANRAAVRYALWLAASIKFLVPFALLVTLGGWLGPHAPAVAVEPHVTTIMDAVGHPFTSVEPPPIIRAATIRRSGAVNAVAWMLLVAWLGGFALVLGIWWLRWCGIAATVRQGTRVPDGRELEALRRLERRAGLPPAIALVSSESSLEPGVFGIMTPVLIWPASIRHLDAVQADTILAHEVAHVRRRDNLTSALHLIVEALFWFHPLVWCIGARLVDERERACDEDVLQSGNDPRLYAESIIEACRASVSSPIACVAGITSSNLTKRIERIVGGGSVRTLTGWKRTSLMMMSAGVLVAPVALGAMTAARLRAEPLAGGVWLAQPPVGEPLPQFEVASVKPNKSGDWRVMMSIQPGGRMTATNATLSMLIRNAYQLQDFQIIGGPGWMTSDHFDINAKAPDDALGDPFRADELGQPSRGQLMLRALLAERFKLDVHTENREMPIYALNLARSDGKLGPALQRSTTDCAAAIAGARGRGAMPPPGPQPGGRLACGIRIAPGNMSVGGSNLAQFANSLSMFVGRIVVDRTGLTGNFDFNLTWTPDQMPQRPPGAPELPPVDPNGPSIFTAVQEQLGLKLDSQRGPVSVLVIDRVEHPTEN